MEKLVSVIPALQNQKKMVTNQLDLLHWKFMCRSLPNYIAVTMIIL